MQKWPKKLPILTEIAKFRAIFLSFAGQSIVAFRPNKARSNDDDETFTGKLNSYDEFSVWSAQKCTPLVREITFENAEELTEEGLPFLILFHAPEDNESIKRYNEIVQRELMEDKRKNHQFGDYFASFLLVKKGVTTKGTKTKRIRQMQNCRHVS